MEYCKSWFWADRMTNNPMSEAEARERHEKREEYTVLIGGFDAPIAAIDVVNDFIPVNFFDRLLRRRLSYHFEEKTPGQLRLTMATRRKYCEATDAMVARMREGRERRDQPWCQFLADVGKVIEGTSLYIDPAGTSRRVYEHFAEPYELTDTRLQAPLILVREPYPEFGHYEHLLREDRGLPW